MAVSRKSQPAPSICDTHQHTARARSFINLCLSFYRQIRMVRLALRTASSAAPPDFSIGLVTQLPPSQLETARHESDAHTPSFLGLRLAACTVDAPDALLSLSEL